jgi:hypothetical protein
MDPRQQTAKQLTHTLVAVLTRCRHGATEREWDAIEEALRRLKEHERLVREVLPDLRSRLTAAESGATPKARLRPPLCCREPGRLFP